MAQSAQPSPSRPGILVGLKAEARFIRQVFPHAAIAASGACRAGALREAARLAACGADCLLSFGLAAGLDPDLPAGSIIVPEKSRHGAVLTRQTLPCATFWGPGSLVS